MTPITLLIAFFVLSFFLSFALLRMVYNNPSLKDGFVFLWAVMLAGAMSAVYFNSTPYDSIAGFSLPEPALVFGSALIVYLIAARAPKFAALPILLGAGLYTFLIPQDNFLLFNGLLPPIFDHLAAAVIWAAISWSFQYLNALNALMSLQTLTIGFGILVLYFMGASPLALALIAITITGAMLALLTYNGFPAYIIPSDAFCQAVGFIGAWLLFKLSAEATPASALILITYFALEVAAALCRFVLPGNKASLKENTNYYQAVIHGLSPQTVLFAIGKILMLLIILASFQLYAGNFFSLPFLGLIVCSMFVYRLRHWNEKDQTLKEINAEFVQDLKDGIQEIKDTFNKDKP